MKTEGSRIIYLLGAVLAFLLAPIMVYATPYASCFTNNAGTISFALNEGGGNVTVTYDDGSTNASFNGITTGTNLAKGKYSFVLTPHTSFNVTAFKVGTGSPSQISVDATNTYYPSPRGVAVNASAKSPYFGWVYTANGAPGYSATYGTNSQKARGLYILNSDLSDLSGRATNSLATGVFDGDSLSPNRLTVATNGEVYVSDCGPTAPNIWKFDPTVLGSTNRILGYTSDAPGGGGTNSANNVHGRIASAPVVRGSLATGDLQILDSDSTLGPSYNEIEYYNIGAGSVPWSNAPVALANIGLGGFGSALTQPPTDLDMGLDGKLFALFYRVNYAVPGLQVFSADGTTVLWDSISADGGTINNGPDYATLNSYNSSTGVYTSSGGAYCVRVSPDGKYVAVLGVDNHITVFPLTNGIPDVSGLFTIANTPTTGNGRDINWDAADNIYTVSSGQGLLRVFSLGKTTTAVTHNDGTLTAGTFSVTIPSTVVTVVAVATNAYPIGPVLGEFTISRTNAVSDFSQPLTVTYVLSGTATNFTTQPAGIIPLATNTVVIAAGQSSTNIYLNAIADGVSRPTTTVVLTLKSGSAYSAGSPFQDTVFVMNSGPQLLTISTNVASTMYKRMTNDYGAFVITRWGDLSAASYTVPNYTYAGTAVPGTDFSLAGTVTFDPGVVSITNYVYSLDSSSNYVGNKSIIVGLGTNPGVSVTTNTVLLTIIDSDNPPAPVLFTDLLSDPNDVTNWGVTSANNNMATNAIDSTVVFGYSLQNGDTANNGVISLPPNGATNALRLTVNKNSSQGYGAAAGVNVYLTNALFGGNYAVRFYMNIVEGYAPSYTTEGAMYGINHTGQATNWWTGSGILSVPTGWTTNTWESDGVWYWISADGGASAGDFIEFTGLGGSLPNAGWTQPATLTRTSFTGAFKNPPYTTSGGPGLAANNSPVNSYDNSTWSDVEIKQINKVVTMSINKTPVFVYTNTTSFTNGYVMLGYSDPFSSVGGSDGSVYFSGLKVVQIAQPYISQIALNKLNSTVVINFTTEDGDLTSSSFALQSSATANGTYADVGSATITQLSSGAFQAVTAQNGAAQFYRLRQK